MISIGCPIYRSTIFADFVYASIHKYTPHLEDGRAEFYFVANDATNEVKRHLLERGFRHYIQENSAFTPEDMQARGLAKPEYITRCYRALNRIYSEARSEFCVSINSDMSFSPGWLEALEEHQDGNSIVCSQLIEPEARANLPGGAIVGNFGYHPRYFKEELFLHKADLIRQPGTRPGGQFTPWLIPIAMFHQNGGYPEGNIADGTEYGLSGDAIFARRYERLGVRHVTALSSVVYHFTEGEMRE